jgi:hypothetical protein
VIFGYAHIPAACAPDIVAGGKHLIDRTKSLLLDMSPDIKVADVSFDRQSLSPVLPMLPEPARRELHSLLPSSVGQDMINRLSGIETSFFLMAEGAHEPSAKPLTFGAEFLNYAGSLRRPVTALLADKEILDLRQPLTLERVNAIGEDEILYLLDLRRRVGPIGAHLENLYCRCKTSELDRVSQEMKAHNLFSPSDLIDASCARALLIDRIDALPINTDAFVAMPTGLLHGPLSILSQLRRHGVDVSLIG